MSEPMGASMAASPCCAEREPRANGLLRQASRITRLMRALADSILPSTSETSTDWSSISSSYLMSALANEEVAPVHLHAVAGEVEEPRALAAQLLAELADGAA